VDWGDGGQARFDHAKAGWALAGKHAKVKCQECHDPRRITDGAVKEVAGKGRKTLLGAPVTCVGCHFDEHRGQVGTDCAKCHDAAGWKPAKGFDHARTQYPLTGLHAKVPCAKCHVAVTDPEGRHDFPQAVAPTYARLKPIPFAMCSDCHKDPHQGRFGILCTTCHVVEGWKVMRGGKVEAAGFHDKTRYPLRGAHAQVACKACHGPWEGQPKARYKDMAFGACADCHPDAHVGQLGKKGTPQAACDRCHSVQGWVPVRFELADHQKTKYPLEGAHQAVACDRCHAKDPKLAERVLPATRAEARRQGRPVKVSEFAMEKKVDGKKCTSCHRDVHQGQFDKRMAVEGCTACHDQVTFTRTRFAPTACSKCHADVHAGQFAVKGATECASCHGLEEWKKTKFVHGEPFTTYALAGKHAKVSCEKCHPVVKVGNLDIRRFKPVPRDCQGCHADFHKGAFKGYEP
jgi:hypothetical protein